MIRSDVANNEPLVLGGTFAEITYEVSQILYQYATKISTPNIEVSDCKNEAEYVKKVLTNLNPVWECISFLMAQDCSSDDSLISEKIDLSTLNYVLKKLNSEDGTDDI